MTQYLVKWEIDIEADSPMEAAEKALEIQRDPDSIATCFKVIHPADDEKRSWSDIDLSAEAIRPRYGNDSYDPGDECPNCKSGTLEDQGDLLACRGECGQLFNKAPRKATPFEHIPKDTT